MVRSIFVGVVVLASQASAQSARDSLMLGIRAYDDFKEQRAVPALQLGLDPRGGPQDSLWSAGLHRLVQHYINRGEEQRAFVWLRWALRVAPDVPLDVNFPPVVVSAFRTAADMVASTPGDDSVTVISWVWTPQDAADAPGFIRYSTLDVTAETNVVVVGQGVVPDDSLLGLSAGTYTIEVQADGYLPAEITIEVLPGITTVLQFRLRDENPGLLYVSSEPWGTVYVDGTRIGYTGVAARPINPGVRSLRIVRPGYVPFDTTLFVSREQELRLGTITLQPGTSRQ